jgi:hypothetical protein
MSKSEKLTFEAAQYRYIWVKPDVTVIMILRVQISLSWTLAAAWPCWSYNSYL